jgi:hypothetical protein
MRHKYLPAIALGMLTYSLTSLGGCASTQVAEHNATFAPSIVNPAAYDIMITSAVYRPSSGLALGAGDHYGDIVHDEWVALVRREVAPTGEFVTRPANRPD